MEEQTPIENPSEEPKEPESSPPEKPASPKSKLLAGALMAIVLVVGLYYLNRYWIVPAVGQQTKNEGSHPLAPVFSLTDITGKPLNLIDYRGKVVVLDFWASWCGPCRIEIPSFIDLQKRYASQGFTMIGISQQDTADAVVEASKEMQMNYPVAVGDDRLGDLYGAMEGLPTTFVIGRDGRIYAKHVGAFDPSVFEAEIKELLAVSPTDEDKGFHSAGRGLDDKIELGDPAVVDSEVPGIDLTKLTTDQKDAYKKKLESQKCTCGCNLTMLKCRQVDRKCATSRKFAQDQLDAYLKPKSTGAAAKN